MDVYDCIAESNRIEGITRPPSRSEIEAHSTFMGLEQLTIPEVQRLVSVYQPNAELRIRPGLDVRVGAHVPPRGGEHIRTQLQALLDDINTEKVSAWTGHVQYETLHPFTDCNGRSGRAIWYWQMRGTGFDHLGFLHAFYYQTLHQQRR